MTSNENKIAQHVGTSSDKSSPVLFSNGSRYTCGHSIVFKILESGEITGQDGIGLTLKKGQSFMDKGSLFVTAEGEADLKFTHGFAYISVLDVTLFHAHFHFPKI